MKKIRGLTGPMGPIVLSCALAACGPPTNTQDAGGDVAGDTVTPNDGPVGPSFAVPFVPGISPMDNAPRVIQVTASSETLGQEGFAYTATPAEGDIVFVDGWEVRFTSILLSVSGVRLDLPAGNAADQSMVGAAVAREPRTFAIDLKKMGNFPGAGGGTETSIPLFAFTQTGAGAPLDPMVRYAFSFDVVNASANATNVNLTQAQFADYNEMIAKQWSTLVSGTATYRGRAPEPMSAAASYPQSVGFRFGFSAPASYINCNNPDNGMDSAPGVAPRTTGPVRAQVTFHTDHFFWLRLNVEDPPLHFDQFAARARMMGANAEVSLEDLQGVAPTNLMDRMNRPIVDRGEQTMGYMRRTERLAGEPNGATGVDDMRTFVAFAARGMGHMNADGLCAIRPLGALRP
ncbi:MAG: hypothetical protein Q8Q09_12795 [Deltaproteobacteria bacterium]|nr:hypothetical protein [Deltaproteobacteria bacterium]